MTGTHATTATVAETVGWTLAQLARAGDVADVAFGVVGSGNFHVTNALAAHGVRFVAARHEGGAATMADAYARTSGTVGILSVHQGPGVTNAMTGLIEAAKSRTPLLVLAPEVGDPSSNFAIDQRWLMTAAGVTYAGIPDPQHTVAAVAHAVHVALSQRRTVVLGLPLDLQATVCPSSDVDPVDALRALPAPHVPVADRAAVEDLAELLANARRPVFIAGRGARHARRELEDLASSSGALLATSAAAHGLFAGDPWNLGLVGGFATSTVCELVRDADVVVGWGCSLGSWTTRHGALLGEQARIATVDIDPGMIGARQSVDMGVAGDSAATARAVLHALPDAGTGYRTTRVRRQIAEHGAWAGVGFQPVQQAGRIDPRILALALDELLPAERTLAVDSGNFMGYPIAYLGVPDEQGFCFTQAFQSIGLGLASGIGAALARPDRLTIAALGDGGALMAAAELETAARLGLPMMIVVFNDEAYGAEVHHFGPQGHPLDLVQFPPTDLVAIATGYGCDAVTVRQASDLKAVTDWLAGPPQRPLLLDAKVAAFESWWLQEAFVGHGSAQVSGEEA